MSTERKTILVIGATGAQGGSVARHLLEDGTFVIRCLTRNPESKEANTLRDLGAEIVQGNLNDVESLVTNLNGVWGVFGVTNFWDPSVGYEGEIQHGKNIGDACKRANVQHLVFSTLDRNSGVPHFESKVLAEDYIRTLDIPTTFLVTSFYFENFTTLFQPTVEEDGTTIFRVAQKDSTSVPMFSVANTGGWVTEIFKNRDNYLWGDVPAVGEYITYPDLVATFSEVTGRNVRFEELSLDEFKNAGFSGAKELALNLQFFNEISEGIKVDRRGSLTASRSVWSGGSTWKDWLLSTGWMSQPIPSLGEE